MFRPLSLAIGLRYTAAKRRNHFISFISLISMLGIFIGVAALIAVLSVMNGFERELRERVLGVAAHATLEGYSEPLRNWKELAATSREHAEVLAAAPYTEGQAMLNRRDQTSGARIRGVVPGEEVNVSDIHENMVEGEFDSLEDGEYNLLLGSALARQLNADLGDRVTLIVPEANVTPAGVTPRLRRFTVSGIFEVGMYDFDSTTAFIHMADGQRLLRLDGSEVTGVRLRLDDMFRARTVADQLSATIAEPVWVTDWTRQHANLFRAVQTEKTVMFVILALIIAVAVFNIVSTLIMMVTDKRADIAILRTLGMPPRSIMAIFLVQGTFIGVIGTALGIAGGSALAMNIDAIMGSLENVFGFNMLPPDIYYLTDLPSELRIVDITRIGILALGLSVLATLYPAWKASRTEPAEALRYD